MNRQNAFTAGQSPAATPVNARPGFSAFACAMSTSLWLSRASPNGAPPNSCFAQFFPATTSAGPSGPGPAPATKPKRVRKSFSRGYT